MFDFVHRNPKNYGINVSLLPTKQSLVGMQFTPPHSAETIFDHAVTNGYPATSLWWPATFPARLASPVNSIPGLGTPDIAGKLGVGIFSPPQIWEIMPLIRPRSGNLYQVKQQQLHRRSDRPCQRRKAASWSPQLCLSLWTLRIRIPSNSPLPKTAITAQGR